MIYNYTEEIIKTEVKPLIVENGCCTCEKCYEDICALVLNHVTPLYKRVDDTIDTLTVAQKNQRQLALDINIQALKAIAIVKESPRHND